MNKENNLLLFYLTSNDRYFVFKKFIDEINKSNYKDKIFLLIVNSNIDSSFYSEYLSQYKIFNEIVYVDCPFYNYLPKVRYAIEYALKNNYNYMMKCDNDIIIPAYTLNYMVENMKLLENNNILTISPTLTTGIPSVEYFLDDFLEIEDAIEIRKEFKKCNFTIQPYIMDYTPLNKMSIDNETDWNYNNYYNYLSNYINNLHDIGNGRTKEGFCKYYKGIHPIRYGFGNDKLNELIIKNNKRFFAVKKCKLIEDDKPYLCDMCFIIKTEHYHNLINNENLIIDGCDEVPLNRYSWKYNLKHYIIHGGYTIHITYNWRWNLTPYNGGSNIDKPELSLIEYEENFINALYNL